MKKLARRQTGRRASPVRLGYKLSSEEQGPRELIRLARMRTAREIWPTAAMESSLSWELPLPGAVAESVVCGPDPERHLAAIAEYAEAGYDHVWSGPTRRDSCASTSTRSFRSSAPFLPGKPFPALREPGPRGREST